MKYLGFTGIIMFAMSGAAMTMPNELTPRDKDFVNGASTAGIREIELSRLAQTRATDARVRAFAEMMIADHGKANDTLAALARDNNWSIATQMDSAGQSELGKLQGRDGKDLDAAYVKAMREDHDKAVKLFRDAAQGSDNQILRDFARDALPTIEHHQEMANALQ